MWFLSKYNQKRKNSTHTPFLRRAPIEKQKKRSQKYPSSVQRKSGVLFIWAIFLGTLFYLLFFSSFVLVEESTVSGTQRLSQEEIKQFIKEKISGKYFGIFPKNSYFLLPLGTLKQDIAYTFPLIGEVSVSRHFPNILTVSLREKNKILLWETSDKLSMIDEQGMVRENTFVTEERYKDFTIILSDRSHLPVSQGEKVIDQDFQMFLLQIDKQFPQYFKRTLSPYYMVASKFSDEIRVKTDEGWEVYFSTSFPLEKSLRTLQLLFEKQLSQRNNLEYIDLRVENRIYYAFHDASPEEVSIEKQEILQPEIKKKKENRKK